MQWYKNSITSQLVVKIGLSLIVMLALVSYYIVHKNLERTKAHINSSVFQTLNEQSNNVEAFFQRIISKYS